MNLQTLNELIWICFVLGIIINWSLPQHIWEITLKKVIGNMAVVLMAWIITEYYTPEPKTLLYTVIYIFGCIVVSFSPVDMFLFIYNILKFGFKAGFRNWVHNLSKPKEEIKPEAQL